MFEEGPSTFRYFLKVLEENNELRREKKEVNVKYEIAALHMKAQAERGPALLFENVKGYDMPVLVNVLAGRRRLALALGLPADIKSEALDSELSKRVKYQIEPKLLSWAPCKEVILDESQLDLRKYPIVTMHEKDAGPYMTGGFVVTRDPETGVQNLSYHRLLLKGRNRFGIFMEPRHLWHILKKADEKGEPLNIAVVVGYHPVVGIAASTSPPLGENEYALAGALINHPIQLVKAENSDLLIPADAEIVLEGVIPPKEREIEAPYGEYTGYYGIPRPSPIFEVKKITQRKDPIYYTITARSAEMGYYFIAKTVRTFERIKEAIPTVKQAAFLQTFFYVISLKKEREGDARRAMMVALAANDSIKICVAVDDDINPRNPEEVIWSIATRCDPSDDIFVIPHTYGQILDPSAEGEGPGRVWSPLCIDATRPITRPFAERARIPSVEDVERMKQQGLL